MRKTKLKGKMLKFFQECGKRGGDKVKEKYGRDYFVGLSMLGKKKKEENV